MAEGAVTRHDRMRILMIGQRGIPATYGGVERAVEEISVRLAGRGHEVTVLCRPRYTPAIKSYQGVRIVRLPTIPQKDLDMIVHTLVSTMYSLFARVDVAHFHGVDPALLSPLVTWRHRVVATSHGRAYLRENRGRLPRAMSRVAERVFVRWPHRCTAVSRTLCSYYLSRYGRDVLYVPNGMIRPERADPALVRELGVEPLGYVLFVGRLESAKGVHLLVDAFVRDPHGLKLVIVGGSTGEADYEASLRTRSDENVLFAGYRHGEVLQALFENARLFVLPSFTEGLPTVLLEALASGCSVLYSDVQESAEVAHGLGVSFACGDVDDLTRKMHAMLTSPESYTPDPAEVMDRLRGHDWESVADSYEALYREVMAASRRRSTRGMRAGGTSSSDRAG